MFLKQVKEHVEMLNLQNCHSPMIGTGKTRIVGWQCQFLHQMSPFPLSYMCVASEVVSL